MAKKDTRDDFVVKVRNGKLLLVHKQIIRWQKRRQAEQRELEKLHKEVEPKPDEREALLSRDFFGSDDE